jgi:hypothetical protein
MHIHGKASRYRYIDHVRKEKGDQGGRGGKEANDAIIVLTSKKMCQKSRGPSLSGGVGSDASSSSSKPSKQLLYIAVHFSFIATASAVTILIESPLRYKFERSVRL